MIKRVIFKKEELLNKISSDLNLNIENVKYGVIEKVIEGEEIVTDIIEVKLPYFNSEIEDLIHTLTDFYTYEGELLIIELSDLRKYINKLYKVEITEVYDFFESNVFGDMEECIAFELV